MDGINHKYLCKHRNRLKIDLYQGLTVKIRKKEFGVIAGASVDKLKIEIVRGPAKSKYLYIDPLSLEYYFIDGRIVRFENGYCYTNFFGTFFELAVPIS
jgi:hypothetical protein